MVGMKIILIAAILAPVITASILVDGKDSLFVFVFLNVLVMLLIMFVIVILLSIFGVKF